MGRLSSIFGSEEFPKAGVAACLVVLILEWGLYSPWVSAAAGSLEEDQMISSRLVMLDQEKKAEVLIFGDSTAATGLDAELLSEELDRRFLNLSVVAACGVMGNSFLFDRYLRYHQPEAIVFCFSPVTLGMDTTRLTRYRRLSKYFHAPRELLTYGPYVGFRVVGEGFLRWLIPSTEWREFFRGFPRADLHSWSQIQNETRENRQQVEEIVQASGFAPTAFSRDHYTLRPAGPIKPISEDFLIPMIEQARALGMTVYFCYAPMPQSQYDRQLRETPIAHHLKTMEARLDRLGVQPFPLPKALPDSQFATETHLYEEHAEAMTRELARKLRNSDFP